MVLSSSPANVGGLVSRSIEYRPAIDGLRAVAVLAVFLFHLKRGSLSGGFVGVDIFFVISGYLITSIIFRDCERNRFSFLRFYQRRIARLLPAFSTVALFTIAGASFIYSKQDLASAGATLSAAAAYVANLKFTLQGNYFVLSPDAQPFLHCWSLSVEEQFYLLFPAICVLVYWEGKEYRTQILAVLCGMSLLFCIVLTHFRPGWAFYLLPTRAWELLTGSIFATFTERKPTTSRVIASLPFIGLVLIVISFFVISANQAFPGYLAVLPVAGTVCFMTPYDTSGSFGERLLSWGPLALVGRMSYSLYLWHWPVFSLVDYKFYSESAPFRIALKVIVSIVATVLCFFFIERPSRRFLNDPGRRRMAFALLACSFVTLIPLGLAIRNANYVDASMRDVVKGGVHFNESANRGTIVLMGDSNASMYGTMMRDLAKQLGLRLTVISVDGGDPLPGPSGQRSPLWQDSLKVVKQQKPDILVIACLWSGHLKDDPGRLALALDELKKSAHFIILITQPPMLPMQASRAAIRNGSRPPFTEEPTERAVRHHDNDLVKNLQRDNVAVVDVEPLFSEKSGAIRFTDDQGKQLYQDSDHLSAIGANLVKAEVIKAIIRHNPHL